MNQSVIVSSFYFTNIYVWQLTLCLIQYAVLNALNKETQSYKWIVSSTLVQKLPEDHPSRGVHAAHAACWNCEKDGMTTIKESGEAIDVVLSIMWISI